MRYSAITAVGTLTVNAASGDSLILLPSFCSGLDAPPLRTSIEDAPEADGGIVFPPLAGAWQFTLGGWLRIESASSEAGYFTALDALENAVKAALAAMCVAPDDVVFNATTLSCWQNAPYVGMWGNNVKNCQFGLVSEATAFT